MIEFDPSTSDALNRARLTPPDAMGDWADVVRRSRGRRGRFPVPTRGLLLLAAAIVIGLGAAAHAGSLRELGTYFSGSSATASNSRSHELKMVAASALKGAIMDHRSTGETPGLLVRKWQQLVDELGPVHRLASLRISQGTLTWYGATTPARAYCTAMYLNGSPASYRCMAAPGHHAITFDVQPTGWGGGLILLTAAVPPDVSAVTIQVPNGTTLGANVASGFAVIIFHQRGRPFAITAQDSDHHVLAHVVVNDPMCLSRDMAQRPGFGDCEAVTRGAFVASMGWNRVGGGVAPAHISDRP